eukprot:2360262-Rhodomonas_salina.1
MQGVARSGLFRRVLCDCCETGDVGYSKKLREGASRPGGRRERRGEECKTREPLPPLSLIHISEPTRPRLI